MRSLTGISRRDSEGDHGRKISALFKSGSFASLEKAAPLQDDSRVGMCPRVLGVTLLSTEASRSLFAQHILGDEEDVGGALGEATHEVGIPLVAERDVDPNVVALGDELTLQIAADSEEHLELEAAAIDAALGDEGLGGSNHFLVVRGEPVINGTLQQHVGELGVVGIDVGFFGESDLGRLFVSAFAEADADAVGDDPLDVGLRTIEVSLDYDADVSAQLRLVVDAMHDVERDLGERRILHVDADEVAGGLRVLGEAGRDLLGERRIQSKAHLGQLDADVGVELAGGNLIEELMIDIGGAMGFVGGRDAFTERVESDVHSLLIDLGADTKRVFNVEAGNEAGAEPGADAGGFGKFAKRAVTRQGDKCGA